MIRILILCFIIINANTSFCQKNNTKPINKDLKQELFNLFSNSYSIGIEINDIQIQENALINILAIDRNDTVNLYKLLDFYFVNNLYNKSYLLSKKYLEQNKNNINLLDYFSKSAEMIDRFGDAKIGYQKLYLFTDDTYYAYLLANCEYMLGNYKECLRQIGELERNDDTKKRYISFVVDENKNQDIVVFAAIYYLKGLTLQKNGNNDAASIAFKKAVEIQPDFELALKNIQ